MFSDAISDLDSAIIDHLSDSLTLDGSPISGILDSGSDLVSLDLLRSHSVDATARVLAADLTQITDDPRGATLADSAGNEFEIIAVENVQTWRLLLLRAG